MRAKEKPSVTITFAVVLLAPELDVTIAKSDPASYNKKFF
jgi:hypothetical protein